MRIRTLAPLAVLFVGLTALGCQSSDDSGAMDETMEQPAAEQMNDGAMNDAEMGAATDSTMTDSTQSDSGMAEEDGGAMEE